MTSTSYQLIHRVTYTLPSKSRALDPSIANFQPVKRFLHLDQVVGEDPGLQTVGGVVRAGQGLLEIRRLAHDHHGTEDLYFGRWAFIADKRIDHPVVSKGTP